MSVSAVGIAGQQAALADSAQSATAAIGTGHERVQAGGWIAIRLGRNWWGKQKSLQSMTTPTNSANEQYAPDGWGGCVKRSTCGHGKGKGERCETCFAEVKARTGEEPTQEQFDATLDFISRGIPCDSLAAPETMTARLKRVHAALLEAQREVEKVLAGL